MLVVVAVPVEGGVGEDEIDRVRLDFRDFGELLPAVTNPDSRGGVVL